jgi:hypothetical protein
MAAISVAPIVMGLFAIICSSMSAAATTGCSTVFGFFAHVVQRTRERLGVAPVLRGRMGSDKTKVGEVFGRIFPRLYFLVDDARYVTGHFNAHMATCLLLAVWADDKAVARRLKGIITSPIQRLKVLIRSGYRTMCASL